MALRALPLTVPMWVAGKALILRPMEVMSAVVGAFFFALMVHMSTVIVVALRQLASMLASNCGPLPNLACERDAPKAARPLV